MNISAIVCALASLTLSTAAIGHPRDRSYHLTALDTIRRESRASGLNNLNEVVGWVSIVPPEQRVGYGREKDELRHAYSYSPASGLHDLRPHDERVSEARGINNHGTVGGWTFVDDHIHATVWQRHGSETVTVDIDPHGTYSLAAALNDRGHVTGEALFSGATDPHAFIYTNNALHDIGTLGGSRSSGTAINALGHVVGWSYTDNTAQRSAFFYSVESGSMQAIATGHTSSEACGINDSNEIVGWMSTRYGHQEAFVHRNGVTQGLAPAGVVSSVAQDINNAGTIVGWYSLDGYNRRAFVTIDGVVTDLTNLVSGTNEGTLAGWTLNDATAINDTGAIVGFGIDPQGVDRGFILMPITPTPGTLACIMCAGIVVMHRRR